MRSIRGIRRIAATKLHLRVAHSAVAMEHRQTGAFTCHLQHCGTKYEEYVQGYLAKAIAGFDWEFTAKIYVR